MDLAPMDQIQIRPGNDGGHILLLDLSLKNDIGETFLHHAACQLLTLISLSPYKDLDTRITNGFCRIHQDTETVRFPDGAGIDHLEGVRIVQIGVIHAEMLRIVIKLLQINAVVDMIDLRTRDLVLPSLLHDVIVSALHGKHHGTGVFVDPLFQPPQGDDGRVMWTGNSEGYDALRPEVCDLRHSFAVPFASHPDAHCAGGWRNRGGHDGIRLGKLLADARQLPCELTDIIDALHTHST